MKSNLGKKIRRYTEKYSRSGYRKGVFTAAAGLVVFVTVYALILPAITMEHYYCGYEEHQHSTDCYIDGVLACGMEEHLHTESCRQDAETAVGEGLAENAELADTYTPETFADADNTDNAYNTDTNTTEMNRTGRPSVFGFGYNLGFETIDGGTYSVLGGQSALLSEVLANLSGEDRSYTIEYVTGLTLDGEPVADTGLRIGNVDITSQEGNDYLVQVVVDDTVENISGEARNLAVQFADGTELDIVITVSGKPEVTDNGVTISAADGSYLPEEAEATAQVLEEEAAAASPTVELVSQIDINANPDMSAAVAGDPASGTEEYGSAIIEGYGEGYGTEETEITVDGAAEDVYAADTGTDGAAIDSVPTGSSDGSYTAPLPETTKYQVLDINLDGVDAENYADGFRVDVQMPAGLTGKNFRLYHVHEGDEPVDITDTLQLNFAGAEAPQEAVPADQAYASAEERTLTGFSFVTENFSEFVLSYTVDFHYEVDGQQYDFSIQGGDTLSLKELLTVLNVKPAEEVQDFVNNISTVEFSDPELIHVVKVEEDLTAGELKTKFALEPEYSANLSEEQLAEMDAKQLTAIDWALVTLKAFDTEETLTITMADGEVFTIRVTDARDPLGLDGRTFAIVNKRSGNDNSGNNQYYALSGLIADKQNNWRGKYFYSFNETASYYKDPGTGREYCGEDATAWKFEYNAEEDAYYVSTGGRYLYIDPSLTDKNNSNDNSMTLVTEKNMADNGTLIKITRDSEGNYRFSGYNENSLTLWDYGRQNTNNGMFWLDKGDGDPNGNMRLCLPEERTSSNPYGASHKASLISAQDLQPGQSVVIYQRVLIDQEEGAVDNSNHTYVYYALADDKNRTDGSVTTVKVWNSSDAVYWRGDPSILWTFKEATDKDGNPNGYYFFENEATGRYLATKADGTIIQDLESNADFNDLSKVVKKEDHVQVALPGLRSGSYSSKIVNWDYNMSVTSGPKVNDPNHDGVPESVSSEDLMTSQEFFFAVRDPIIQRQLTEVDTVSSSDKGIHITMYDFSQSGNTWYLENDDSTSYTEGWHDIQENRLPYMTDVIGSDGWEAGVYTPGLVSDTLPKNEDGTYGWPTTEANHSLGDIFESNSSNNYTVQSWSADNLFLQSVYDSTGYFRYSAFENFARFNPDTEKFTVYEQIGVPVTRKPERDPWGRITNAGDEDWDAYYKRRGNFMPFDDLILNDPRYNEYNAYDSSKLSQENPRQYEDVYRLKRIRNYFFGMVIDAKFQQDKDGLNNRDDPVRYEFNGDDDMWIYIDGVLVLDIGGVHDAFEGYIDFATGDVVVKNAKYIVTGTPGAQGNTYGYTPATTIKECFEKAGVFPDGTPWEDSLVDLYFRGNTFADYSSHDFKMIYMERGAGASNLEMQFNLTTLEKDLIKVTKEMPETETGHNVQDEYGNAAFYYKVYRYQKEWNQQTNAYQDVLVPIKKTDVVPNSNPSTTYQTDAYDVQYIKNDEGKVVNTIKSDLKWQTDEIFELRPGHTAIFPVENHGVRYYVEEVEPEAGSTILNNFYIYNNDPETDAAEIVAKKTFSGTELDQADNKQIFTDTKTVQQRAEVIYNNKPADGLVNELRITKQLHGQMLRDDQGNPILSEVGSPYFEYAIYLENNDGKMVPYSLGPYYVIDKYGRFVYYTKTDNLRHYYGFTKNNDGTYSYYNVSPTVEGIGSDNPPSLGSLIETTTNPKITEHAGEEGFLGDVRDGDTLVIVGLMEGTHFIVDEIKYSDENDFLTLDPNNEDYLAGNKYLFERTEVNENVHVNGEDVPADEHATGHLFNDPDKTDVSVSEKAAEGDIRLDCDTEVQVHNRSTESGVPLIVKKNWDGVAPDDQLLANTKVNVTIGRYILTDEAATIYVKKTGVPTGVNFSAVYEVRDSSGKLVANIPYSPALANENGVSINVLPGIYTVTERIFSQDSGYNWTHDPANTPNSNPSASRTTAALTDGDLETVTFGCATSLKTGSLTVKSSYNIPAGGTVDFSGVTYTVYEGDENSTTRAKKADGTEVSVLSYDEVAGNGYTINGLKVGTYTVKESGVPITSGDYELTDHTPAWQWHVTRDVAEKQTVEAEFRSTYTLSRTNINYIIGKPDRWSTTERVSGTNGDFAVGKTVKLSFYCSETWDRIQNCNSVINETQLITYGGETLTHTRTTTEGNNSKYEITFTVKNNADLRVNVNANPNAGELWGVTWESVNGNRSVYSVSPSKANRLMTNSSLLGAAGDSEDINDTENNADDEEADTASPIDYGTAPTPPANKKYVDDTNFTMADPNDPNSQVPYYVILEQSNNWNWSTAAQNIDLPAADSEGNRYYYYIKLVEEENGPDANTTTVKLDGQNTFIVGKDRHMTVNTSTTPYTYTPSPLEVNNVVKGSLQITKEVTVNGNPVSGDLSSLVDGVYSFTVVGTAGTATANEQFRTVDVTVSGGQASTEEIRNLTPGQYTVTEIAPTNGTSLRGTNGISVTVQPGKVGTAAATASFTNNIDTTQLMVDKSWSDSETVDHDNDSITYTLYRVPYTTSTDPANENETVITEYNAEAVTGAAGYTGVLSVNNSPTPWSETVTNLPKTGEYTLEDGSTKIAVSYRYYVSEGTINGYKSTVTGGEAEGTYTFHIVNEPLSPTDLETQVDVEKKWNKSDGTQDSDKHVDDFITFRLSQKKYEAKVVRGSQSLPLYPVTINLINADSTKSDLSTVVYIPGGYNLEITPHYQNNGHTVSGNGFDTPNDHNGHKQGTKFIINNVNQAREVTLKLDHNGSEWGHDTNSTWTLSISNDQDFILYKNDILTYLDKTAATEPASLDYTMTLNEEQNNTVIVPAAQNTPGQGVGSGVWEGSVKNLPFFERDKTDGKYYVYTYELSEIRINTDSVSATTAQEFNGETPTYYVRWQQNNAGIWTITNQKKPAISVTIYKVDEKNMNTGTPRLPGAKFKLVKYRSLTPNKVKDTGWDESVVTEADENPGVFSFTSLEAGYYEIVETKTPDGYIRVTENPMFQVRTNPTTGAMEAVLVHTEGANIGQPIEGNATDLVKIENTSITIGNTPGAALPNTGGPGTQIFTILGSILLLGAGIMLWKRRRLN